MNDPNHTTELEQVLARQPLRKPGASLDGRMARLFGEAVDHGPISIGAAAGFTRWKRGVISALAACLALAGLLWMVMNTGKTNEPVDSRGIAAAGKALPAADDFNPVRIDEVWWGVQPQGVVEVDGDSFRRYQRQRVDRVQLIDEKNNVRIEYTTPRRETVVMPVKYD